MATVTVGSFSSPFAFSYPTYGATPQALSKIGPTATDFERMMVWLDAECAAHGWDPIEWQRPKADGLELEPFTPNVDGSGLRNRATHLRAFWMQFRDVWAAIGPRLFQDYETYSPFARNFTSGLQPSYFMWLDETNPGNGTAHPVDANGYHQYGKYGKLRKYQAEQLAGIVNPGLTSSWVHVHFTKTATATSASVEFHGAAHDSPTAGDVSSAATNAAVQAATEDAADVAWAALQAASWTASYGTTATMYGSGSSPTPFAVGSETSCRVQGSGPTGGSFPQHVTTTVRYTLSISVFVEFIGDWNWKSKRGLVGWTVDGRLPISLSSRYASNSIFDPTFSSFGGLFTIPGCTWNPWSSNTALRFGVGAGDITDFDVGTASQIQQKWIDLAETFLPVATAGTSLYTLTDLGGFTNDATHVVKTLTHQNVGDMTAMQELSGDPILWLALVPSNFETWRSGSRPAVTAPTWSVPNTTWLAGTVFESNGTAIAPAASPGGAGNATGTLSPAFTYRCANAGGLLPIAYRSTALAA